MITIKKPHHDHNKRLPISSFQGRSSSFDVPRRAEGKKQDLLRRNRSVRHDGLGGRTQTKNVALRMSMIHVLTFVTCWTPYLVSYCVWRHFSKPFSFMFDEFSMYDLGRKSKLTKSNVPSCSDVGRSKIRLLSSVVKVNYPFRYLSFYSLTHLRTPAVHNNNDSLSKYAFELGFFTFLNYEIWSSFGFNFARKFLFTLKKLSSKTF